MPNILCLKFGKWMVEIRPRDGGRLSRLAFRGQDLLTAPPRLFRVPRHNFGLYETRPVYGYDDCFPTLGIWWNNSGYPAERDIAREECAFEPIPGPWSSLERSYRAGQFLLAPAGENFSWRIDWLLLNT